MSKKSTENTGILSMGIDNYNYNGPERRITERRGQDISDRRNTVRFSDILGRRCGIDRRLPVRA